MRSKGSLLVLVLFLQTHPIHAATFTVANGDVPGLTAAINAANGNGVADTIDLAPGGNYPLGSALPAIASAITINGNGATIQRSSTAGAFRVLFVDSGASLTLSKVTIKGGSVTGNGGGIYNDGGNVTLHDSVVTGNRASSAGGIFNWFGTATLDKSTISNNDGGNGAGGLYNHFGTMVLNNSTVSGNTAGGQGGIRNSAGTLTINDSTISGNSASHNMAGGLLNDCSGGGTDNDQIIAIAILTNSTISGNSAVTYGGGIVNLSSRLRGCTGATIVLNHSTVTANRAATGGGIVQDPRNDNPAEILLKNTIVGDNTGSPANCVGTMTSQGYNLDNDNTCGLSTNLGDRPNMSPQLLALALNAPGTTQTHALPATSPAIDAVPTAFCIVTTDQRGVPRPRGVACDIGAYELALTPAQSIEQLIALIQSMGLPQGVTTSLIGPLGQATQLLNDVNPNNDNAVCGKLDAFINQVNAKLQNGQLTAIQASQLLQSANAIRVSLGC